MSDENEKTEKQSKNKPPVDNSAKAVDKSVNGVEKTSTQTPAPKGKRGGRRPGSGRKPGKLSQKTIEKLAVKKEFEDRVAKNAHALFNAQVTLAMGAQYLLKREQYKTAKGLRWGKFEKVTDPDEMIKYLDGDFKDSKTQYFMLTADKPDSHAIDSLLDRGFGKAPQNLNIKDDRPDPIATILKKFGLLEDERDSDAGQAESTP